MHSRDVERGQLKRKLQAGISIHMPAPRRIGKTWTINRLANDLLEDNWIAIEVDVQGVKTPKNFARELCKRIEAQNSFKENIAAHFSQRLKTILGGGWDGKPINALSNIEPIEFVEILIESLNGSEQKVAILIDEIAYFFLHCAEADQPAANAFAYKLRSLQQRYGNVCWVLTGSIGLNAIAKQYGLEGAFVDFENFVLEPFTKEEARSYMRDPNVQQQFNHIFDASDKDFEAMFDQLGWLAPYYLKLIANEVRPSIPSKRRKPAIANAKDFEDAFEKLLQPNRTSEFAVWREHVKKNLPSQEREIALVLLHKLSEKADGETLDTLVSNNSQIQKNTTLRRVKDVLAMLIIDGLVAKSGERYEFRSGLVRRYWLEYEAD